MSTLNGGRIGVAAQALGIARASYEASVKYSKQRKAFDSTISNLQAIQFKLADMATSVEAASLLVYRAAKNKDEGKSYMKKKHLWENFWQAKQLLNVRWKLYRFTVDTVM